MVRAKVLLPQPDSPTRPKIVPCWTRNVTSLTADTEPSAVLNLTEMCSSSRAGADPPGTDTPGTDTPGTVTPGTVTATTRPARPDLFATLGRSG